MDATLNPTSRRNLYPGRHPLIADPLPPCPGSAPTPGPAPAPAPTPSPDSLQATLERARRGDAGVLDELKEVLDDNPSIWRDCYDLVAMSEQAWLDKMAGVDLVASQSFRRHLEQLKADLRGHSPSPIEKLLVDRIVAAWLAVQHAEMTEAFGDAGVGKVAQLRLKRLESANRRFLAATKALAVVRRLTNGLRIEISHTHDQAPAPQEAVGERVREFLKEEAAGNRTFASAVGS